MSFFRGISTNISFLQNGIVSQFYSLENMFPEINGWMYFPLKWSLFGGHMRLFRMGRIQSAIPMDPQEMCSRTYMLLGPRCCPCVHQGKTEENSGLSLSLLKGMQFKKVIKKWIFIYWGFLKWWDFPNKPMGFPSKNDHFGVFLGVPPFKETPIYVYSIHLSLSLYIYIWVSILQPFRAVVMGL